MAPPVLHIHDVAGRAEAAVARTIAWVKAHDYRAYEPADGNTSVLFPLTGGRVWPMRILQQVVLRAPFNVRPWLGVPRHESAIGRGYMAWGYLRLYHRDGWAEHRRDAEDCLDWLTRNRAAGYAEWCWGDPYDYATRSGRRPYGEPLLIWSALIGLAFLDAHEILGEPRYLEVAASVGRWIMRLPAEQTSTGRCLSYNAYSQSSIHNSNAMGAAFLARLGTVLKSEAHLAVAQDAMRYTCARQRPDGAWFYAEAPKFHWVDNFHTGYNLSALQVYRRWSKDASFDDALLLGGRYFAATFFETDGRPRYFHDRLDPVDIQCAAQGIETLVSVADQVPQALAVALTVADWTLSNMQAADGHFCYRHLGWTRVGTPMLHWGQGTMVKALATLLERLDGHE